MGWGPTCVLLKWLEVGFSPHSSSGAGRGDSQETSRASPHSASDSQPWRRRSWLCWCAPRRLPAPRPSCCFFPKGKPDSCLPCRIHGSFPSPRGVRGQPVLGQGYRLCRRLPLPALQPWPLARCTRCTRCTHAGLWGLRCWLCPVPLCSELPSSSQPRAAAAGLVPSSQADLGARRLPELTAG